MPFRNPALAVLLLAVGVAAFVNAAQPAPDAAARVDRLAADLLSNLDPGSARSATPPVAGVAAVTVAEVGDAESFGRPVRWLGVAQAQVVVDSACLPPAEQPPGAGCVQPAATPGALTSFAFEDLARIELPRGASNSLLCHGFSPVLQVEYANPAATDATALLRYTPTLTIESPVLDDPSLINPQTGQPFDGSLVAGMSASEVINTPLRPGESRFEVSRDTASCIAGFLTRRSLVEAYGLTEAQARRFFRREMTVRMNVSGQFRDVAGANLIFGLRVTGD